MFGGLTKTSSRIAIAAALGLVLGGFAFKATPAQAADLGGDCCADLEERVAELEATTVRKGNKKVSVTLSGWVVKSINYWDDGGEDHVIVGDKDYDLGTRFAITGSAQISPGWSAGYNVTVLAPSTVFGFGADQFDDTAGTYGAISTLYSYMYIKSDTLGTLNWGHLSPASDNPAVLADISGTVIESNAVFFEGPGFLLRPKGAKGKGGLSDLTWGSFLTCQGLGAGIGADCFGAAQPAIRYDSPTWGGFRFETSYGSNRLTGPLYNSNDSDFWDIALFYTGDWNSIKLSAAAAYTWIENGVGTGQDVLVFDPSATTYLQTNGPNGGLVAASPLTPTKVVGVDANEVDLFQVGASIMHKPSGLGVYGMYQHESSGGFRSAPLGFFTYQNIATECVTNPNGPAVNCGTSDNRYKTFVPFGPNVDLSNPDTDVWYVKPFWRKAWSPIGATVLFGEYGNYEDMFVAGQNLCNSNLGGAVAAFCNRGFGVTTGGGPAPGIGEGVFVTGSEVERWGLGVVQEIDSAAMHLWARWQHQEISVDLLGFDGPFPGGRGCENGCKIKQSFDDWDLFQVGGVIFF